MYTWLSVIQIKCYEQVGSTDYELFVNAYAVDILNGNNVYDLIDDRRFNCLF